MAKSPAELIAHYLEFGTPVEFDRIAEGVISTLAEAGYAIVPREPTPAMLIGARDWSLEKNGQGVGNDQATGCWKAMVGAAK